MSPPYLALSVKQPWAALLAHGLKTIEVRTWATDVRGRVLIHAAKVPDERPTGWTLLTPAARPTAKRCGGIIAVADLVACRDYRNVTAFAADQPAHHNPPEWFAPPVLYGFQFAGARLVPFRPCRGYVRFFKPDVGDMVIEDAEPARLNAGGPSD
jgi:hypothetical protein